MTGRKRAETRAEAEPHRPFPVVGIGASAGGLAAFQAFFSGIPKETPPGMAFVLVQHLAPDHKSMLAELIRNFTAMEVFEVEDGMQVQPNCVYVIPPARDLALMHGALHLLEPTAPRGLRLPIDFFFRSLAQDQGPLAIGVVLSGTGSDGTLGARAIKAEGGLVLAQNPASTEFDGMPRSAITTGAVDFELPPAEMAEQLRRYVSHRVPRDPPPLAPGSEHTFQSLFVLLRSQTGHDFSQYKPNTLRRRTERRMAVHQIPTLEAYFKFLQQTPKEVEALFQDLLIGVTSFFRDPFAFKALEDSLPSLFEGKSPGEKIRVWVPGCSTGEEAYSIAIMLAERVAALKQQFTIQVFATDIDSRAIATARAGQYSASALADVTPERLARFFTPEADGGYRINKAIRDLLIFSEQDVLKDPPFSKLDLLSCRNLLIYLGPELQKRLIPLFYYALRAEGLLLLGTSEGVGDFDTLFRPVDRKAKLYRRRVDQHGPRLIHGPLTIAPQVGASPSRKTGVVAKNSARELTEQALLQQFAPPSALVNPQGDIIYLHGRTGMFLEPVPGEAGVNNILKMAREGLRATLTTSLHRAMSTREPVQYDGLRVKTNGHFTHVNLSVRPMTVAATDAGLPSPLFLVMLQEAPDAREATAAAPESPAGPEVTDARITALKQELKAKEEYLRSTNEELERSAEELMSSNEEMQSVNEELQSTNEELETSKEELQSVNEELATVNTELQIKVVDLSRANNDMNNLLAGTGIGTVFVDRDLKILRFTPAASAITNLIPSDVGRPVGHIVSNLVGYDRLVADSQEVLETLKSKEVDVQTTAGRWFTLRIQPYRTIENVIEGVVMSFTDVTETVKAREALRKVNEVVRLAVVVRDAHDAITVHDLEGRTLAWNPGAEHFYGWSEAEALKLNVKDRVPPGERSKEEARAAQLARGESVPAYETQRLTRAGDLRRVAVVATALLNERGQPYAVATTERPAEATAPGPVAPQQV